LKALQGSDGAISGNKFEEIIEGYIDQLKAKSNGIIYAFGEVVNILSERKQYHAALVLESKWNDFIKRRRLQLLCGYSLSSFSGTSDVEAMTSLCHMHGHINTAEHNIGDYSIGYTPDSNALRNHQIALLKLQQRYKSIEIELERRKAAEAALHKSIRMISETTQNVLSREKDRYQNVLSSLPVGVYGITFGDDDEFYINKRFSQLVGRSENDIRDHSWIDVIHPDDRKAVETNWPFCNFNDNQEFKFLANRHEYRLIHNNGDIIWVKADTSPTVAEDGHILGYLHTLMDITELKNTERGRLEAKQAAEEHQRHRAEEAENHRERQDQWIDSLCHEVYSLWWPFCQHAYTLIPHF
jgi:PAS domain S-box-containing protein